jgi:phasin family protein
MNASAPFAAFAVDTGKLLAQPLETAADAAKKGGDAALVSVTAYARAAEEIARTGSEYARSSIDAGVQAAKSVVAARTPADAMAVQAEAAKAAADAALVQANRVTDILVRASVSAFEPFQSLFAKAAARA